MPESAKSEQIEKLRSLQLVMESAREQYVSAKKEYDLAVKQAGELDASTLKGNVRRIVQAYASCLERYHPAAMDFNQFLLDRAFPEEKASGAAS